MSSPDSIPPRVIPVVLMPISLRSFGPIPWSSSEGFLVAFTPGFWRIQVSSRGFLSEDGTNTSHKTLGFITLKPPSGDLANQDRKPDLRGRRLCSVRPVSLAGSNNCDPRGSASGMSFIQEGFLEGDLMNPRTQGILVTLKPTDEDLR